MAWFLGFLGLIFGATIGGGWGAVILCIAGIWIGKWINRNDEDRIREHAAAHPPSPAPKKADDRPPLDDFNSLREEVLSLRRRVELLEKRRGVPDAVAEALAPREAMRAAAVPVSEIKSEPLVPPATPSAPAMPTAPVTPAVAAPVPTPTQAPTTAPATPKPGVPPALAPAGTRTPDSTPAAPPKPIPAAPTTAAKPTPTPTPTPAAASKPVIPPPPAAPAQPQPRPQAATQPRVEPKSLPQPPRVPPAPKGPSLIARLFSGNIVAKVGVVVLFFGVGFLLKFAYDRDMFPPQLRLLGVALAAAALFGTGWWLRKSRRLYALILQGGASGLAYLDVFFALKTYGFINPVAGFALFAALGVATTFAAVRQDSRSLAVLGLGGAFLAPVLASTGGGSHVLLFSYYLLLNLFVLGVSWFRAWRELNLTGWLFTFVIGLFWGNLNYRPELFGSVEPFVLAFFAIYLVVPILFATRQPPQLKGLVDGTLVFGTPAAVAFMQADLVKGMPYGLAWSAAIGGALYAVLSAFTWRRDNMRMLAETYAALAVGLGTLAVFFAFDAYPTFAFWTIEGAAILWVGLRQDRAMARGFAILVQLAGAGLFILDYDKLARPHWLMNDAIYGSLLIAVASLISARLLYRYAERLRAWETLFGAGMLLWGALWWSIGGLDSLKHGVEHSTLANAAALFFLTSFAAAELAGRWMNWSALRNLAGFHPLVLAIALLAQFNDGQHLLAGLGGLAWPAGFAVAFWSLHRQEKDCIAAASSLRYAGLWLVLGLAATWEEVWLLENRLHVQGMLFALVAHGAAYLRFRLREQDIAGTGAGSSAVLLWAMVFWFAHGYSYAQPDLAHPALISAMLGFVAGSALLYEFVGSLLGWRGLRHAAAVLALAMPVALLAQSDAVPHPFASQAWIAWIAAFSVAYLSLFRQQRDGIAVAAGMRQAVLWLVLAVIVTWEEIWLLQEHEYAYGMLLAVLVYVAAFLRFHFREREEAPRIVSNAMLLWAMAFWFLHGYCWAESHLARAALIAAMLGFVTGSALVYEFAGSWLRWNGLRQAAGVLALAMPVALLAQIDAVRHPFAAYAWVGWIAAFSAAWICMHRHERDGIAVGAAPRYALLWSLLAVIVTWEEAWLLQEREFLYGMLLAALGYAMACLRFHYRDRGETASRFVSTAILLWAMFFWFAHGYAYGEAHWSRGLLAAAMLGLVAVSSLLYELGGSALGWRGLRHAASLAWAALPVALLAQFDAAIHPFASYAWLAWPAAYAVAYWSLYRQERDQLAVLVPLRHAGGLWLAVAIAALELKWQFGAAQFGEAWLTSVWGFCAAAALAGAVFWGDRGKWPVALHRDTYRALVLGPVGAFTVAWALFANFKAPGSMAPLPYLPLLNPVDAMVGLSLWALWRWSRWFIDPDSEGTGALRKAAGALGFIWLNGIALRSIHYWAGVPYEFEALYRSVLVQSTLSLLWTLAAMALMFLARRRLERALWVAGAALLGAVVAKLFLVDLANSGTVERIVSFIGVGALLLVIGYLAPVPPGEKPEATP